MQRLDVRDGIPQSVRPCESGTNSDESNPHVAALVSSQPTTQREGWMACHGMEGPWNLPVS